MTDKSGGDNAQIQAADQSTAGLQDQNNVAAGGTAAVQGMGADALATGLAGQAVDAALMQAAGALGGGAGSDNVSTNTNINIG